MNQPAKPSARRWWPWTMVPVGLALGLWLGWRWMQDPTPSPEQLFQQYFVPHPLPLMEPFGGKPSHWAEAAQTYQAGDYGAAQTALEHAEKAGELPPTITQFYIGQCRLATGRTGEAADLYRAQLRVRGAPHPAIRWYLALALLKMNDISGAADLLREIENDKGFKSLTATQLLGEME